MILTESFFIYLLVWRFVMEILYKDNLLPNKLEDFGHKLKKGSFCAFFLLGISECKFCMNFWSSTLGAIVLCFFYMDWNYLFWGVFCTSINAFYK